MSNIKLEKQAGLAPPPPPPLRQKEANLSPPRPTGSPPQPTTRPDRASELEQEAARLRLADSQQRANIEEANRKARAAEAEVRRKQAEADRKAERDAAEARHKEFEAELKVLQDEINRLQDEKRNIPFENIEEHDSKKKEINSLIVELNRKRANRPIIVFPPLFDYPTRTRILPGRRRYYYDVDYYDGVDYVDDDDDYWWWPFGGSGQSGRVSRSKNIEFGPGEDYDGKPSWPEWPCGPGEDSTPKGCRVACHLQGEYGDLVRSKKTNRCIIPPGSSRNTRSKRKIASLAKSGFFV